ncbi:hypothetical protein HS041_10260 [Planomonospora sp. ID67723]|uniref:hypothetical protein n=1 Tax=Planomonospora sp. ID67723 TaxID=2738134 RepID=UPI0018C3AB12|nr:hypothetical protein [Planomonospora sp. ID67723]MBG0828150.1 hypothetical protein [Planomonospora sp. ID67723]
MRFTKSLAAAGALGLAVLTASPALADGAEETVTEFAATAPEVQNDGGAPDSGAESETPADTLAEPEAELKPAPKPEAEAEAEPEPEPKPEAEAEAEPEPEPKPEAEAEAEPELKPAPKPEAEADEEAPLKGVRFFDLASNAVHAGEKVGYKVIAHETRATSARISSPAFSGVHTVVLAGGKAIGTASTWDDLKPGEYPVTAEVFLGGKFLGSAETSLTITAKPVEEAPFAAPSVAVTSGAAHSGEKVGYKVVADRRATGARISSPAFSRVHTVALAGGKATGTASTWDDLKPGEYPVTAEILLGGKVVGTAQTRLFVKARPVVKPVPVSSLNLELEPRKIRPGQSYYAGITTRHVEPGAVVTVEDPGGRHYRVRLDRWGTGRVLLTVPGDTDPGTYKVVAYLPGGPGDSAKLTVVAAPRPAPAARLSLALHPHTVVAGGHFTAVVSTRFVAPGTRVTVFDPAGEPFTVKIGRDGVGARRLHVPSSTSEGAYWFTAKLPTGQKAAALLTVKAPVRPSGDFTPRGGAQTGGGLAESPAGSGALTLGGTLVAGGSGLALYGRRRGQES